MNQFILNMDNMDDFLDALESGEALELYEPHKKVTKSSNLIESFDFQETDVVNFDECYLPTSEKSVFASVINNLDEDMQSWNMCEVDNYLLAAMCYYETTNEDEDFIPMKIDKNGDLYLNVDFMLKDKASTSKGKFILVSELLKEFKENMDLEVEDYPHLIDSSIRRILIEEVEDKTEYAICQRVKALSAGIGVYGTNPFDADETNRAYFQNTLVRYKDPTYVYPATRGLELMSIDVKSVHMNDLHFRRIIGYSEEQLNKLALDNLCSVKKLEPITKSYNADYNMSNSYNFNFQVDVFSRIFEERGCVEHCMNILSRRCYYVPGDIGGSFYISGSYDESLRKKIRRAFYYNNEDAIAIMLQWICNIVTSVVGSALIKNNIRSTMRIPDLSRELVSFRRSMDKYMYLFLDDYLSTMFDGYKNMVFKFNLNFKESKIIGANNKIITISYYKNKRELVDNYKNVVLQEVTAEVIREEVHEIFEKEKILSCSINDDFNIGVVYVDTQKAEENITLLEEVGYFSNTSETCKDTTFLVTILSDDYWDLRIFQNYCRSIDKYARKCTWTDLQGEFGDSYLDGQYVNFNLPFWDGPEIPNTTYVFQRNRFKAESGYDVGLFALEIAKYRTESYARQLLFNCPLFIVTPYGSLCLKKRPLDLIQFLYRKGIRFRYRNCGIEPYALRFASDIYGGKHNDEILEKVEDNEIFWV